MTNTIEPWLWRFRHEYRLAFRELGLAIGLQAIDHLLGVMTARPDDVRQLDQVEKQRDFLVRFAALHTEIEAFWLDPANQGAASWREHLEINRIMLASSLVPERFFTI